MLIVRSVVSAILLFSSTAWAQQQQPNPPVIRVESNLVLVDLIATDKRGYAVADLKRDEIRLRENGRDREIAFFQFIDVRPRVARPSGWEGQAEAPETPQPGNGPGGRIPTIVVVDLNSMDLSGLRHSAESVHIFLRSLLASREPVMLVALGDGMTVLQPFTTRYGEVLYALSDIKRTSGLLTYGGLIEQLATNYRALGCQECDPLGQSIHDCRDFLREMRNRNDAAVKALGELADYVGDLPGRKHVILFSSGYPIKAFNAVLELIDAFAILHPPSAARLLGAGFSLRSLLSAKLGAVGQWDSLDPLAQALNRLNAGQATVYAIDSRGLVAKSLATSSQISSSTAPSGAINRVMQLAARYNRDDISAPQEFLKTTAEQTGGRVFINRNDLEQGVRQAFEDGRAYYLIGFVPVEEGGRKRVKIDVDVSRKGVEIRHRRSYFAAADPDGDSVLTSAFKFPGAYFDFPIQLRLGRGATGLEIEADVPTGALRFGGEEGKRKLTLELYGALLDESGKWVDGKFSFARRFPLELDADAYAKLMERENVTAPAEAEVTPGEYELIVVVRQLPSGLVSAERRRIEIKE